MNAKDLNDYFEVAVKCSRDAVLVIDEECLIRYCNSSAERILESAPGDLLGESFETFIYRDQARFHQCADDARRYLEPCSQDTAKDFWINTILGRNFPAKVCFSLASHRGIPALVVTFWDVSAARAAEHVFNRWDTTLKNVLRNTIEVLGRTVAQRDPYTALHQVRVAELSVAIGEILGLSKDEKTGLELGGLLHDLGKIYIPGEILTRPGRFSSEEYSLVKTHATVGHQIVSSIEFPWPVAEIAHQHHERIDGSGYPMGLKGDQISLLARITGVSDVMESMTSHRPYRPGLGVERALDELTTHRGTRYDSDAVDACQQLFTDNNFEWRVGADSNAAALTQMSLKTAV